MHGTVTVPKQEKSNETGEQSEKSRETSTVGNNYEFIEFIKTQCL